ncbi:hypothetical protein J2T57_001401 [Natronocella acetinitrilica]|uniref:Uncharacterized protein n=1 Tax=Natronocella acetinitrilica TaxID=414046 RepID=A0AAE3KB28_9GAMM|nr:hypothetical protein [Natronocella acetinitrilica]MCP1674299.1 hypothetical protein [Natronocella acetinitrilica]
MAKTILRTAAFIRREAMTILVLIVLAGIVHTSYARVIPVEEITRFCIGAC